MDRTTTMPARVLLADDDVELATMLGEYLGGDGFNITVVHDGEAAVRHALSGEHSVIVLDVMMPKLDGIEALRRIRMSSQVPVIMLTARGDDVDRILGLELGADDYVPKPCTPRELSARVRAILRRLNMQADTGPLKAGPITLWSEKRLAQCDGAPLDLTSAEFNILHVLVLNAGRVVSKKEISQEALGRPLARYDRAIDVHLSSIRQKLGSRATLIHTVRGLGYQLAKE
jgi:DNA-binding response OmpR family regulator